jgi:hypothetical protein
MHDRQVLDVLEECRAQPHAAVLARDAEEEDLGLARLAAPPRPATTACDWRLGGGWRPGLVLLVRVPESVRVRVRDRVRGRVGVRVS